MSKLARRPASPPSKRFLTYATAAEMLGYQSRQGLWRAVQRGDVPAPVKSGGLVRFDEQSILDTFAAKKDIA